MLVLGRRDLANLDLVRIGIETDDQGLPSEKPEVTNDQIVLCGMTSGDGCEKLTACSSVNEMRREVTWFVRYCDAFDMLSISWYVADFAAFVAACKGREATPI